MSRPAGELETLGPQPGRPTLSTRARIGLFAGVTIFVVGALVQIIAVFWLGLLLTLVGGSAEVLVHTGGLEPRTFAVCSVAAITLDGVLLLAIATRAVRQRIRRTSPPTRARFAVHHPFVSASAGLLLALAFVIACGWTPSPYFPYPLATTIVLANAYYFGLVGVVATARLAELAWHRVRNWGLATQYRAGFLTASLALVGAAGLWLLETQWYQVPLHRLHARLEVEGLDEPTGALSGELDGLCLAADELEPLLAHSSSAPACGFLASDTKRLDDCFSSLMTNTVPRAMQAMRRSGLNDYDLDDALMKAVLATCTREPPPDNLVAYFFTVARNQTRQMAQEARRTVVCDRPHDQAAACSPSEPSDHEARIAKLWEEAFCQLDANAANVVRRRLEEDESFREIGEHLGVSETRAKDTFHNAIKKLRRWMASCALD